MKIVHAEVKGEPYVDHARGQLRVRVSIAPDERPAVCILDTKAPFTAREGDIIPAHEWIGGALDANGDALVWQVIEI